MHAPDRLRNVAVVGHRGSGKTSLTEALLFQAGAIGRLGSVVDGTTASDTEPDERARSLSITATHHAFTWRERKVNLLDTPGEASFVAQALGALRVCEAAVFCVNAVTGVEPGTRRLWDRATELGLARLVVVTMLDRERADFFRAMEALKGAFGPHVVATELPLGAEHDVRGVIDLVDMRAFTYEGATRDNAREVPIPDDLADLAAAWRERLMDEVCEVSEGLMERYLEGGAIEHDEIVAALKAGTDRGHLFPVTCGVATRNLGTDRLLDAIVEDLPSPVLHGALELPSITLRPDPDAALFAYVFKTKADAYTGRQSFFRVYQGTLRPDTHVLNTRAHAKERIGHLGEAVGPGDIGQVAKLKDTRAGDWLADRDEPIDMPAIALPQPVMAFAIAPVRKGDEEKLFDGLRRLQEEDPTIDVHRDPETGEELVAGLTQVHVEVVVGRLRERYGVEVELRPPRVPYRETVRGTARAHGRHKKQTGGRGQFGDCHIVVEPLDDGVLEFVDEIRGGSIPGGFIPAVRKGVEEAMAQGPLAGCPVRGVRVRLVDGSHHTVDSSEMAFKTAGAMAMREALAAAQPVLLEPIMLVTLSVPEASVGDVIGDLSARRGRPLGMEGRGGGRTEVRAEVPMAELLAYAPDLRAITGGQGELTLELARYEEVPQHLAAALAEGARGGVATTA